MKATNCNMLEDGYQHKTATKRSEIHKFTCVPIPNACNQDSTTLQENKDQMKSAVIMVENYTNV